MFVKSLMCVCEFNTNIETGTIMTAKISKMHKRVLDKNRKPLGEEDQIEMPENSFWDDAKQHYVNSINAIEQVEGSLAGVLKEFVEDGGKIQLIKDPVGLANNINILSKDIAEHTDRLNNIYSEHCGRSGSTKTPDDHMALLHIHGKYAEALEIYDANIIPTVAFIMEQVGAVEELLESQKLAAAIDVNVVTDVEVKTTPVEETAVEQISEDTVKEINESV